MTWRTYLDERVLEGTEADLFITAVQLTAEDIYTYGSDFELDFETDNRLFDTATPNQKLFLLNFCLSALLKPEIDSPQLTHILEATVYCPFAYLKMQVETEIKSELAGDSQDDADEEYKYMFRRLLWKPYQEYILPLEQEADAEFGIDEDDELAGEVKSFSYQSTNFQLWDDIVDDLAHRILWDDEDWKVTSVAPALADGANELSLMLGITDEYLTTRIGIVSDEEGEAAYKEIHSWNVNNL